MRFTGIREIVARKWDSAVVGWQVCMERDRSVRRKRRSALLQAQHARRLASSRWGAAYSVFDGEELLEASLRSVRGEVDYIVLVYQTTSWFGAPASPELLPLLRNLRALGLADELVEYRPDPKLEPDANERVKRNLGLDHARRNGCTYFTNMDCDEFYLANEMAEAKAFIVNKYITHSFVPIQCYGEKPTQVLLDVRGTSYVPFFCKIQPGVRLRAHGKTPLRVDPTRQQDHYWGARYWVFDRTIQMHHMSYVRKDLQQKIDNSSFKGGKGEVARSDFTAYRVYEQPDIFGIGAF